MGTTEEVAIKAPRALDLTQTRGTKNKKLTEEDKEANRLLSKTRSRVEHIFLIAKRIFGFSKVRYKGLTKNTNFAFVLFALSNLYMVRRRLLQPTGA
jgi:IS5 family transposase